MSGIPTYPLVRYYTWGRLMKRVWKGLFSRRFHYSGHGAFASRQPPVAPESMHLIAAKFRLRKFAHDQHCPAEGVDFLCVPERLFIGKYEDFLEHFDHVIVRMIVV